MYKHKESFKLVKCEQVKDNGTWIWYFQSLDRTNFSCWVATEEQNEREAWDELSILVQKEVNKPTFFEGYCYSFYEAIDACLDGKGFIRGINFKPGVYAKLDDSGIIVLVDGGNYHRTMFNMMIYREARNQLYKIFSVANKNELELTESNEEVQR